MRAYIAVGLLCVALVACGGTKPTSTPYTGAKMHGYPTPGEIRVLSDDEHGVTLVVLGSADAEKIATLYADSWKADGWSVVSRQREDTLTLLTVSLHESRLLLLFSPYKGIFPDGSDSGIGIRIPPFERYDWNR